LQLEIVPNDVDLGDIQIVIFIADDWGSNILTPFKETVIETVVEDEIFTIVEDMPTFKGKTAEEGFREYISQNLKYPQTAIDNGIFGKVFVQFVIDQKGNVIDLQVVRSADPLLDNEALRLIRSTSGMWTPGKQRKEPVKVRYTFPITFRLQ